MFDFGDMRELSLVMLADEFSRSRNLFPPRILDQFGRPVEYAHAITKIGDTITIRRPQRFLDTAQ